VNTSSASPVYGIVIDGAPPRSISCVTPHSFSLRKRLRSAAECREIIRSVPRMDRPRGWPG